ncbi:MAG: hypothetical protein AVDCRST_MAG69-2826, partial [uncultured Solirubrobacteraceae bacterium]
GSRAGAGAVLRGDRSRRRPRVRLHAIRRPRHRHFAEV